MNNLRFTTLSLGLLLCASSGAPASDFIETAPVVSVVPLYSRITEPWRECWTEYAPASTQQEHSYGGAIVGGIAGGVVGSQIGSGSGRTAATAAGAATGALIGDRAANPGSSGVSGGAIIGGITGALIGSQIGSGRGRDAAAAVGAVTGALLGSRMSGSAQEQDSYSYQTQPVQRCRYVYDGYNQEIIGYSVTYRYRGRNITTTLPYDPGSTVQIGVGVIR